MTKLPLGLVIFIMLEYLPCALLASVLFESRVNVLTLAFKAWLILGASFFVYWYGTTSF